MRAIIVCTTDLNPEEMRGGLERIGWWPHSPQDTPTIQQRKVALIEQVWEMDQNAVRDTFWYTIYSATYDIWGLVNAPTPGRVTIRLFHSDLAPLKVACEHFVRGVQKTLGEPDRRGIDHLDFVSELQILPKQEMRVVQRGEILTETRLHTLLSERRVEYRTATSALVLSLIIFAATTPPAEAPLRALSPSWGQWFYGILERVGTAAITTFTMFCFDIVQRLRHLKETTVIRWL